MLILITNDDGIAAHGIEPLVEAFTAVGEVWVVAPQQELLARSHAVTLDQPLRVEQRRPRWFAVSGTPTDCVFLAVHELLPARPALVLSGINRGTNLGDDVHYSGTVAAALEACLLGIPALAISLAVDWSRGPEEAHWETAATLARRVADDLLAHGVAPSTLLNLNVPDRPMDAVQGLRVCRLGLRRYRPRVEGRTDLLKRRYYWIGAEHRGFHDIENSDGPLLEQGYATLSPMHPDLTAFDQIERVLGWPSLHPPRNSPRPAYQSDSLSRS
jgi:5'-nucleotidase